jgi:type II secretory pathway component PulK
MKNARRQRQGFAMIMAIALMALAAMALAAAGAAFYTQVVRTRLAAEDAQLRQLLLAGAQCSIAHLDASTSIDGQVLLPDGLTQQGAVLTLHAATDQSTASADQQVVQIDAALPRHRLSQRVEFWRHNGIWQIADADLGR